MRYSVVAPNLGVNDQTATLVKWLVDDGAYCAVGDAVCVLETTKTAIEIPASHDGYLRHLVEAGEDVNIGDELATITDTLKESPGRRRAVAIMATEQAVKVAGELGVDLSKVEVPGVIREADVRRAASIKPRYATLKDISLSKRTSVVIYGAGNGGRVVSECLELGGVYEAVAYIDDTPRGPFLGILPVISPDDAPRLYEAGIKHVFVASSRAAVRLEVMARTGAWKLELINAIHPTAFISPSAVMGIGNQVKAGAVIDTRTRIGNGCIIDNGVIVAHDCDILDGVHLAPGCALGSSIIVGEEAILGPGVSVSTGVKIGRRCIIATGSSMTFDAPDDSIIVGVPGRIVGQRRGQDEKTISKFG